MMMVNSTTNDYDKYDVDRGDEENDYDLIIMMTTETPMMLVVLTMRKRRR
jgi:hypothetical protein